MTDKPSSAKGPVSLKILVSAFIVLITFPAFDGIAQGKRERIRLTNRSLPGGGARRFPKDKRALKRPAPCLVSDPAQADRCKELSSKKDRILCIKEIRSKHPRPEPCPADVQALSAPKPPRPAGPSEIRIRETGPDDFRVDKRAHTGRLLLRGRGSKVTAGKSKKPQAYGNHARLPQLQREIPVLVNLMNLHTREVLPLLHFQMPPREVAQEFLMCRWTRRTRHMDIDVLRTILDTAMIFRESVIEVVSGFRHPKFNEMLRKKGRNVARRSRHTTGQAVDFRLPGIEVETLREYLLSLKFGGVGIYTGSGFLHLDSGPVRTWSGG